MSDNLKVEKAPCAAVDPTCGAVVGPITVPECLVIPTAPAVIPRGEVVVKIPVVISEDTVQIDVETTIRLSEPAYEIKRIRKNLFLTQCRLLPMAGFTTTTGKLYLKGFVRKNIEYATAECVGTETISGGIRTTTAYVPFQCSVPISFLRAPVIIPNGGPVEIETFDPNAIGRDLREEDFQSIENFNERVFCELVSVRYDEAEIQNNGRPVGVNFPLESTFTSFTEKMVLHLTFKLLQMQQVRVAAL